MSLTNVVNKNNCTITHKLDGRHHWLFYCAC